MIIDEDYIKKRNKLIPEAERYANEVNGKDLKEETNRDIWIDNWNKSFHTKMEELVEENRLINWRINKEIL